MPAKKGTHEFSSKESRNIESEVTKIINNILNVWSEDWALKKQVSFSDLFGNNDIAYNENGKSTVLKPDGGMLFFKNKPVALFEVKHQKARNNACERALKYIPIFESHGMKRENFFVFLDGSGFEANMNGHIPGQTGATAFLLKKYGATVYINADLADIENSLKNKLELLRVEHEL